MRITALVSLLAACTVAMPVMDRRQFGGDMVNGPTALSNANVNNGAQSEGSLTDEGSMDGAQIINPIGNDLTKVNTNQDFHDNVLQNANFNVAQDTQGGAVVGNNNEVFPGLGGHSQQGIVFRRQVISSFRPGVTSDGAQVGSGFAFKRQFIEVGRPGVVINNQNTIADNARADGIIAVNAGVGFGSANIRN
ncbi:hypothetical protein H4S02_000055 [Coemansia sp. RSA 2611]|nr:hypothetical protein H4S02_000055 [Coemansia sp. RSA 2611]